MESVIVTAPITVSFEEAGGAVRIAAALHIYISWFIPKLYQFRSPLQTFRGMRESRSILGHASEHDLFIVPQSFRSVPERAPILGNGSHKQGMTCVHMRGEHQSSRDIVYQEQHKYSEVEEEEQQQRKRGWASCTSSK